MRELPVVLCLSIVAAFAGRLAAQPSISEDVTIPGGTAAIAEILGIDPAPERARFVSEVTRLVYDISVGRGAPSDPRIARVRSLAMASSEDGAASDTVPIPLTVALWGQTIFHRPLSPASVLPAILSDREASLLCHGLAALDDDTLAFLAAHPALLARIHERSAAAFSAFSSHLHIRNGRVVPPGGASAAPLWESLVASVADPERFLRELFELHDGRAAYLFDTIASVDPRRQAFALGLWIADPQVRVDRFKALMAATAESYHDWRVKVHPFTRPLNDLATLLARVDPDERGRPALPSRAFWARAFDVGAGGDEGDRSVDAAWLAEASIDHDLQVRSDRVDQYGFGVRLFSRTPEGELPAAADAVRAFPQARMLMLSLERIGIAAPSTYVEAARRAHQLAAIDGERGFTALAQFQAAVGIVGRLVRVQSIAPASVPPLIDGLLSCRLSDDGKYGGAIVDWLDTSLRPALSAPTLRLDAALTAALAGRRAAAARSIAWEGQQYRLDLAAAELRRLSRVRAKQAAMSLDLSVDLLTAARTIGQPTIAADDLQSVRDSVRAAIAQLPSKADDTVGPPPGVSPTRGVREIVERAARALAHLTPGAEVSKRESIRAELLEATDRIAGEALISLAYAIDIGDGDSPVLLGGNAALRHDFGLALRETAARSRVAWALPKTDVSPMMPWRMRGSLLGLDVGLSPLALRRINSDRVVGPPSMTSNERDAFAASVAMMNPFLLRDDDRDAIVESVRRGRDRAASLRASTFDAAADAVGMDGWRIRAGRWMLAHGDDRDVLSLFSATELLSLGGGVPSTAANEWGMSGIVVTGCVCLRLAPPGGWTLWIGRPQLGAVAVNVADLNLRVAEMLADIGLPAALARYVLAAAVQDFIDESKPTDPNDWLTLVRSAQRVSRERLEDYVASAAAIDGPLLPEPSGRFQ